ncbi:hypothetical protein VOLCADRAFT_100497 [Volvox carteri f. nagariensis]|uniref:Uncharacterized protein n=1 Tax=Volvox carteri f. nagariensis TaxID=3068 RepID=D8UKC0_VOLCA|nr:uncharacterized protein VOLCADRAFT_100497 [Volvox carteri f. nagariensis]EFJ39837.1 hypothetical protein VOLCADRAFT_100497 [Volvox carteri f. nagariensis]|eukprot:XP_002959109.1 hypothetical protein VOLCADRAFT_100497 [Volvox carteri f. nagariensis]
MNQTKFLCLKAFTIATWTDMMLFDAQYDFRLDEQDWEKVCWGRLPKAVARSPGHQLSRRAKWAAVLRRAAAPEGGSWAADFRPEDMTPQRLQVVRAALAQVIDQEFFQGTFHKEIARRRRHCLDGGDSLAGGGSGGGGGAAAQPPSPPVAEATSSVAAPSATYQHSLGRVTFWRQVWASYSPSVGTPMRLDGVACTSRGLRPQILKPQDGA